MKGLAGLLTDKRLYTSLRREADMGSEGCLERTRGRGKLPRKTPRAVNMFSAEAMAKTRHKISRLSLVVHSPLITCQEVFGTTIGHRGAGLHIILSLKVSDCTEIITREIDSGISLKKKILGVSGGF